MNPFKTLRLKTQCGLFILSALLSWHSLAGELNMDSTQEFDNYLVHYSVFNSAFIPADIAKLHNLVRAKDQALVNISVQDKHSGESIAAQVEGTARNLMQQQKTLTFVTLQEPGASYAIAALRHSNEEVFHFDISIKPLHSKTPLTIKFTRKLYTE